MTLFLLFSLFVFTSDKTVAASNDATALKTSIQQNNDEIVVTANKNSTKKFTSNRSIDLITHKDIDEKIPRTTPEAFYETPGVFVQKTNHGGGAPIIRGFVGPRILLTLSGVRLNNSLYRTGPNQYLNITDLLFMNSIEVMRGSGSVLYGSDAMGGVIGLYPYSSVLAPDGSFYNSARLMTSYESADKGKILHGRFSSSYNGGGIIGAFSLKSFSDLRAGGDVGTQPYSGYDQRSFMTGGEYNFLDNQWKFQLFFTGNIMDDAGRTDKLESKHQLQVYDNTDYVGFAKLKGKLPSLNTKSEFIFSWQRFFERKTNTTFNDDFSDIDKSQKNENSANTFGLDANFVSGIIKNTLNLRYGAMYYRDTIDSARYDKDLTNGTWVAASVSDYIPDSTYASYGIYSVADYVLPFSDKENKFLFNLGGRYSGIRAEVPARDTLPHVIFKDSGFVFTSGLQYLMKNKLNLSLLFNQGFRAPNLQESAMLGDAGNFFHVPNYSLSSEKSNSAEAIVKFRPTKNMYVSFSGYITKIDGLISRRTTTWNGATQVDGKDIVESYNADSGLLFGGEAEFSMRFLKNYSIRFYGFYVRGEQTDDSGETFPMSKIPPLTGYFSLKRLFKFDSHRVGAIETYVLAAAKQDRLSPTDEKDVRIPDGGTPGWWTLNFRAYIADINGLLPRNTARLVLSVNNVFDKKYKYHASGIYSPGFNVLLSLDLAY